MQQIQEISHALSFFLDPYKIRVLETTWHVKIEQKVTGNKLPNI